MTNRFDVLTQQLFQKNIEDCSVEELQTLASEYPYFAPAQYVLLQKLKETNSNDYQAQLQKAILYYHDPLVFDQFIDVENYEFKFSSFAHAIEQTSNVDLSLEPVEEPETDIELVEVNNEIEQQDYSEPEEQVEGEAEPTIEVNTAEEEVAIVNEEEQPDYIEADKEMEALVDTDPKIDVDTAPEPKVEMVSESEQIVDTATEPVTENEEEINVTGAVSPVEMNNIQVENSSADKLSFEPYHTVDYFASQGIKLSQEEATKDRFGKQLKSFTEWLKTMKKLPVNEQVKPLDIRAEQAVENLAAHSVETEEIYTETMAEVWLRQGNREKAIEIFSKLSLLNPSKRAYFAAKIDSLK
jgi:hypothetical protein